MRERGLWKRVDSLKLVQVGAERAARHALEEEVDSGVRCVVFERQRVGVDACRQLRYHDRCGKGRQGRLEHTRMLPATVASAADPVGVAMHLVDRSGRASPGRSSGYPTVRARPPDRSPPPSSWSISPKNPRVPARLTRCFVCPRSSDEYALYLPGCAWEFSDHPKYVPFPAGSSWSTGSPRIFAGDNNPPASAADADNSVMMAAAAMTFLSMSTRTSMRVGKG